MTTIGWTQGPWQYVEHKDVEYGSMHSVSALGGLLGGNEVAWVDTQANARLIAAAPELYAALCAMVDAGEKLVDLSIATEQAVSALAKAEGGQP